MMSARMNSRRPDGATPTRLLAQTVFKGRDFWAALVIGGFVFFILLGRDDVEGSGLLAGIATVCGVLFAAIWITERWLFDKLFGTPYGEVVGSVDPESHAFLLPYSIIRYVALAAMATGYAAAAFVDTLGTGWLRSLVYAVPSMLMAWTFLGTVGLMRITGRHMRRMSRLENLRRKAQRDGRNAEPTDGD